MPSPPRWFEPKVTLSGLIQIALLVCSAFAAFYGIIGRADGQAKDIATLQQVVVPLPAMQTDLTVIKNTIATKTIERDRQFSDLSARVDQNQGSVDAKLDKLIDGMTVLSNQVAALTAVARAQERQP